MPVEVVAIISPAEGKADRVKALINTHAERVRQNEPGCWKYHLHRQTNGSDFVMIETYNDTESIAQHGKDPQFKAMGKTMKEEGLLAKPMKILVLKAVGGFASKSKL